MADIYTLIEEFRRSGAVLEVAPGEMVRFKTGHSPLPTGLLEELQARKHEVLAALRATPSLMRRNHIPSSSLPKGICPEFVGSRTILRHPGFACGRCGNRYEHHSESSKASASAETLKYLARLLNQ